MRNVARGIMIHELCIMNCALFIKKSTYENQY